jgi:hypothetical protein
VPEHRRPAGQRSGDVTRSERGDEGGKEALGDVEDDDGNPITGPEGAPDVRGADVPTADGPDVDAARRLDDPVSKREAAGEIAGDDEGESLDQCPFQ